MSTASALYFAAILLIGVPAAFRLNGRIRNATAFAMVAMWLFGRVVYWLTGEWMPLQAMVLQDMVVIAAMFVKEDWRDCSPYTNLRYQFCALWNERSPWDRAILALFPVAWIFYFPVVDGQKQFWTLWGLGLLQLIAAGLEALTLWQAKRGANPFRADSPDHSRSDFTSAWASEAYG